MLRPAFFSLKVFIAEDIPQSKSFSYFFFLEKNLLTKADDEVFPVFFLGGKWALFTCNKFKLEVRAWSC